MSQPAGPVQVVRVEHGCGCATSLLAIILIGLVWSFVQDGMTWWSGLSSADRDLYGLGGGALFVFATVAGLLVLGKKTGRSGPPAKSAKSLRVAMFSARLFVRWLCRKSSSTR